MKTVCGIITVMKNGKYLKILLLTAAFILESAVLSYADLILDAPDLSGGQTGTVTETVSAGKSVSSGIVISDRPTELVPETAPAIEPAAEPSTEQKAPAVPETGAPSVPETSAPTVAEPEIQPETKPAAEPETGTSGFGPVVSDAPNVNGTGGNGVTGIESAPMASSEPVTEAPAPEAPAETAAAPAPESPSTGSQRVYLDFEIASPAHTKSGMKVTRAAVKLNNGSWQTFGWADNIRYPYYRVLGRGTVGNGAPALIASASAKKFGDVYTGDGEMKHELYLLAEDCTVKNYVDINTGSAKRAAIVKAAFSLLGKQYTFGGNGPDAFDCSGFVKYVMAQAGISVPRTSTSYLSMDGQIKESALRPGDVLARAGHCGVYVGDGIFIHASDSGIGVVAEDLSVYNRTNKFTNFVNVAGD